MTRVRHMWEHIRNIPGLKGDLVAVMVLVALGASSAGYLLSGYEWDPPWKNAYVFSAELEKAPGVQPDALQEVRIAGVPVGKITAAEPQENGRARVEMRLDPGHTVYTNARLVLRSKSPLNVMYVTLNPGGPPGKPLPENGTIPLPQTERAIQPFELLDKLDERTRTALTALINNADIALADAPQQLPPGLRATDNTMAAFRPVVEQLQTRRANIQQLVTAFAQISTAAGGNNERLARMTSSLQQTLVVLGKRDKELGATLAQVPGLSQDVRNAMTNTSQLTNELDPALDALHQASDKLPPALSRLSTTVDSADELFDTAAPVVRKARPVVADLRPLSGDLTSAVHDLAPVTGDLPPATAKIVPWMNDLSAFVYQTSSAFSLSDANGGFGRANVMLSLNNPTGGLDPGEGTGNQGGGK